MYVKIVRPKLSENLCVSSSYALLGYTAETEVTDIPDRRTCTFLQVAVALNVIFVVPTFEYHFVSSFLSTNLAN